MNEHQLLRQLLPLLPILLLTSCNGQVKEREAGARSSTDTTSQPVQVIHDTTGISYHRADGSMARVSLNAVSVTPLMPLQFDDTHTYAERMRSIVHMRPAPATQTAGKP